MIRSVKALLLATAISVACFGQAPSSQTAAQKAPESDKASAYYHFAMGRLYNELGQAEGSREDINKAIQHYQEALKLDPNAGIIFEELTDLYIQSGRLRDAMNQAQDMLKQNPDNLAARRMLGRIYTRMIGNTQTGRIDENFLKQATEQYQKITEKDPKDADSWVTLGRLYGYAHNSPEAEKAFNAAIKIDPENQDALTGLALLYLDLGDTKQAIEKLKAITDKNPNERTLAALAKAYEDLQQPKEAADVLKRALSMGGGENNEQMASELAKDLLQSNQLDEALHLYTELAAADAQNPEYQLKLAEIYMSRDLGKARAALNKAKQMQPDNLAVRYDEAGLLEREGKRAEAITVLKALLDSTAKRTYSEFERNNRLLFLRQLGADYVATEQYPQAIDTFKQMITLDPDAGPDAEVAIIDAYRASKDFAEAMREAESAQKKYPKAARMLAVEHAQVLADQGKVEQAAAEMKTLVGTSGKTGEEAHAIDRTMYLEIAQTYEKGKRWAEMGKALDEAEKLSANDKEKSAVYFMRGSMFERQKKFDAAEAEFKKVLEVDPDSPNALNYLGYMLADRNVRLEEAAKMIQRAVELDPENGAYLDSLAWVYYRQGKYSEAEPLLIRAIQQMPDPTVHDHLGDVYAKMGRTKDAITQWQASVSEFKKQAPTEVDSEEMAKVTRKLDEAQAKLAKEGR